MDAIELESRLRTAADLIRSADALLIGAGAGMGVDSGLPAFRDEGGLWNSYPASGGRSFSEFGTPRWFHQDPVGAWGLFGHFIRLFIDIVPHAGFRILRGWGQARPLGAFVYTSNVDGHFQKAGFGEDQILECHGSIHYLQCAQECSRAIWPTTDLRLEIDESNLRCRSALPLCPHCGFVARPNVALIGDGDWIWDRSYEQRRRYVSWLRQVEGKNVVAVELGAGLAIPTVREECESQARTLIRINSSEAQTTVNGISIPLTALEALVKLETLLTREPSVL